MSLSFACNLYIGIEFHIPSPHLMIFRKNFNEMFSLFFLAFLECWHCGRLVHLKRGEKAKKRGNMESLNQERKNSKKTSNEMRKLLRKIFFEKDKKIPKKLLFIFSFWLEKKCFGNFVLKC